jgi:hypothetical protein
MSLSSVMRAFGYLLLAVSALGMVPPWETKGLPWDPFPRSIGRITAQNDGTEATLARLEPQLLALLQDHQSPEEKGIIYASIAHMYAQKGYTPPDDPRTAKRLTYVKLALQQPLDPLNVCRMYSIWSDSGFSFSLPPEKLATARRKAALIALMGLRSALEHAPATKVPVPAVDGYVVDGPSVDVRASEAENRRQMEANVHARHLNELLEYREAFVRRCLDLYSRRPYDPEELRDFSEILLAGHDDVVKDIMEKLAARMEKMAPPTRKPEAGPQDKARTPTGEATKEAGR